MQLHGQCPPNPIAPLQMFYTFFASEVLLYFSNMIPVFNPSTDKSESSLLNLTELGRFLCVGGGDMPSFSLSARVSFNDSKFSTALLTQGSMIAKSIQLLSKGVRVVVQSSLPEWLSILVASIYLSEEHVEPSFDNCFVSRPMESDRVSDIATFLLLDCE